LILIKNWGHKYLVKTKWGGGASFQKEQEQMFPTFLPGESDLQNTTVYTGQNNR
jgi:hypothetical protein